MLIVHDREQISSNFKRFITYKPGMWARPTKMRPRQDRGIRIRDRGEALARPSRDRGVGVRDDSPIIQVKVKETLT